jgi:hypothetical protein
MRSNSILGSNGEIAMTEQIDLSPRLDAIRDRHPEWWRDEAVLPELKALWGDAEANEHAVMPVDEEITVALPGHYQWYATIQLSRAQNGWYAMATHYSYSLGGGGSAPSLWNDTAYTSREAGMKAGFRELISRYQTLDDARRNGQIAARASGMIQLLQEAMNARQQLSLF